MCPDSYRDADVPMCRCADVLMPARPEGAGADCRCVPIVIRMRMWRYNLNIIYGLDKKFLYEQPVIGYRRRKADMLCKYDQDDTLYCNQSKVLYVNLLQVGF
jgi:hypothetical protein